MASISLSSSKTAWVGALEWSYSGGYVTVTMYTWKTDGYPSSAPSGANFRATITVGSSTSETFQFQQQEVGRMTVGTFRTYVSGSEVYISGRVEAPYGVSMYGYPLTGGSSVTLYTPQEPEEPESSQLLLGADTVTMGQVLNISIVRSSPSCTHRLYAQALKTTMEKTLIATDTAIQFAWEVPDLTAYCEDSLSLTVRITCNTYQGSAFVGQTYRDVTVMSPPATTLACPETAVLGEDLAITLDRKSPGYTHDITWQMEEHSGCVTTGAGAAWTWRPALELAALYPRLTAFSCTLHCVTLLGSLEVGTCSARVLLQVPDNDMTRPRATMTLTPWAQLPEAFSGMYIRGCTGVRAEFTAESAYSPIQTCSVTVDGITTQGNPALTGLLSSQGQVTVTGRVTDQRGFTRTLTQVIPVVAYDRPRVIPYPGESAVMALRCDADGTRNVRGQSLLIRAGRRYTPLEAPGGTRNGCTLACRYKSAAADSYSENILLLTPEDTADTLELVLPGLVPELKTGYTVQLLCWDTLGSSSVLTLSVPALTVPFHLGRGGSNAAVGKYCDYTRTDAFEIGFTTYFDRGIALRPVFTAGAWSPGTELGSSIPEADTGCLGEYTLYLAVTEGEPRLLLRLENRLWGQGVKLCRDQAWLLEEAPGPITALYALI